MNPIEKMEETTLTPMVNVDPFQLPQVEPLALTVGKGDFENIPSFTLQLLVLEEDNPSGKELKDPLAESSNNVARSGRPAKKKIKVNCNNSDQVKVLKRQNYYKNEKLHLECEWAECVESFYQSSAFADHVSHHVQDAEVRRSDSPMEDVFVCLWAECGFECVASAEMVRHINFHSFHTKIKCHGQNMLECHGLQPCTLDPAQRNVIPDLSDPFRCEWEGCELWSAVWDRPQHFYSHVASHGEEMRGRDIRCGWRECGKTDGSVSKLKEHLRCHSQERLVGCPTCGGLFANRVKFLDHCKRQHAPKEESFTCNNCGKKFALERLLRDHMRSHINHYKCPHCDMTCPSPSSLNNHIKYKHMDEKPFSCDFCDYRGKTPFDVKGHIRVHYAEIDLKCTEADCEFTCRAQSTMKMHYLKKHTGSVEQLYACHLCDKRYNRGTYLTKHLINVHNFSWPSGHSRFRYSRDESTGLYRLQTIRFESADLQEQLECGSSLRIEDREVEDEEVGESLDQCLASPCTEADMVRTSSPNPGYCREDGDYQLEDCSMLVSISHQI